MERLQFMWVETKGVYIRGSLFEHTSNYISLKGDSFFPETIYFTSLQLKFSFHENNGNVYQEKIKTTSNISTVWGLNLEFKVL